MELAVLIDLLMTENLVALAVHGLILIHSGNWWKSTTLSKLEMGNEFSFGIMYGWETQP